MLIELNWLRIEQPIPPPHHSAAAWLLGSRVLIPLRAWMFVACAYMLYCPV
jgi:hypothetical protein